ncbi:6471_t:CDS:2 [Scutellospora calospora]|uniref:6471_t:CDS:1 n=1 Tax=Scutellospora calospora TaxID=85575 RepID=A0ACA9KS82_9GLOM|nr:6471_t:CDS:2 [Scutellospora calospora]
MSQPVNQTTRVQPQNLARNLPQNANILINTSFDNLTVDQKYEILSKVSEIIEAGHCHIAFPKEDSLRVTTVGLHLNTTENN